VRAIQLFIPFHVSLHQCVNKKQKPKKPKLKIHHRSEQNISTSTGKQRW